MNEICNHCGKEKKEHVKTYAHKLNCIYNPSKAISFSPSGRVSVSVEFVEAVRRAMGVLKFCVNSCMVNLEAMIKDMKEEEKKWWC